MNALDLNHLTNTSRLEGVAPPVPELAYVQATEFQAALFDAIFKSGEAVCRAQASQRDLIRGELSNHYGNEAPTYAQFKADRKALRALSLERGLVDDQYARKLYNAAVVELWGALPVSDSPAAQAKRLHREAVNAVSEPQEERGVPETRQVKQYEEIGQFIARFGAAAVLVELAKILATENDTVQDAYAVMDVARHIGGGK